MRNTKRKENKTFWRAKVIIRNDSDLDTIRQEIKNNYGWCSTSGKAIWGTLRIHFPVKLLKVILLKYNHLNSLEMVLRAYSKWRNVFKRQSTITIRTMRICGIWTKILFLPSHFQLSMMETPLQKGAVKNTGLLLPQLISEASQYLPRRDKTSHPALSWLLLRLSSKWVQLKGEGSLCSSPIHHKEALPSA